MLVDVMPRRYRSKLLQALVESGRSAEALEFASHSYSKRDNTVDLSNAARILLQSSQSDTVPLAMALLEWAKEAHWRDRGVLLRNRRIVTKDESIKKLIGLQSQANRLRGNRPGR